MNDTTKSISITKRISGIVFAVSLFLTIVFELLSVYIPPFSAKPTVVRYRLSIPRDILFVIAAISFTVFIFTFFLKKFGTFKSIFYTVFGDSLIAFAFGGAIMLISQLKSISEIGISALESLYYYLLGFMIMLVSSAVFGVSLISFFVITLILYILKKKRQNRY